MQSIAFVMMSYLHMNCEVAFTRVMVCDLYTQLLRNKLDSCKQPNFHKQKVTLRRVTSESPSSHSGSCPAVQTKQEGIRRRTSSVMLSGANKGLAEL
jgi:hypothetical protein